MVKPIAQLALAAAFLAACTPPQSPVPTAPEQEKTPTATTCDTASVTQAATAIVGKRKAWTPAAGVPPDYRAEAVTAVWTACPDMPLGLRYLLSELLMTPLGYQELVLPAGLALSENDEYKVDTDPVLKELETEVRAHRDESGAPAEAIEAPEPAPSLAEHYDLFHLERFGIVTRSEFMFAPFPIPVFDEHIGYLWMMRIGVPKAAARTIARELILGRSLAGNAGLRLPAAPEGRRPDPERDAYPIYIGPETIEWSTVPVPDQEPTVVRLDGDGRISGASGVAIVPTMVGELFEPEREGQVQILQAHRATPVEAIMSVILTASVRGFEAIDVAVLVPDAASPIRRVRIRHRRLPPKGASLVAILRGGSLEYGCKDGKHTVDLNGSLSRERMCNKDGRGRFTSA